MKKLFALTALALVLSVNANAQFDVTAAANSVKQAADTATAKVEETKATVAAQKQAADKESAAKKAEQEKAVEDAKASLNNLKNSLTK